MAKNKVDAVVVTNTGGHTPVGILTHTDCIRLQTLAQTHMENPVGDYATTQVIVGNPDMDLSQAMILMSDHNVRHLPITAFIGDAIDDDSRFIDMFSVKDVLDFLARPIVTKESSAKNKA